ncbi:TolC family protein [Neolewinella aurantiaca]|uniref:TolC family protein n=1 Tax=Neolewinella aurantiaca TaxID=2602767 RepID=A0A5C7FY02_9BACT|nr:TolC family protein [Neolewinella aurantiaca]TXF90442.1 TolC family protein [Neolewinella aurantiaca]
MRKIVLFTLLLTTFTAPASAQNILSLEEVKAWVMSNHPLAQTADAVEERGIAEALASRAALDPKIDIAYDRKDFKGTEYYDYGKAEVSWQSPYALKIAGGYQVAEGTYLNAERTLPEQGQAYLALKLPLLRGLLTDETRIGLRKGELAADRQRAAADVIRNDLRYDLRVRYLEWAFTDASVILNEEIEAALQQRLVDYRQLVRQGDKPAVDTLEATVYLGLQRQAVAAARVDRDLAGQALAELYWPLTPNDSPEAFPVSVGPLPDTSALARHPQLTELSLALADARLSLELKNEARKPTLNLEYYLLGDGFDLPETDNVLSEAYKMGLTASYPLLNRKARAGAQLAQLKVVESGNKLTDKSQALRTKALAYRQAIEDYTSQIASGELLADQAARLLAAEQELFALGESTQFLVNTRQQALLKARLSVVKLRFAREKLVATYRFLLAVE